MEIISLANLVAISLGNLTMALIGIITTMMVIIGLITDRDLPQGMFRGITNTRREEISVEKVTKTVLSLKVGLVMRIQTHTQKKVKCLMSQIKLTILTL